MTWSLARRIGLVLLAMSAGCDVAAPHISVAATCAMGSVPVQIEAGVSGRGPPAEVCRTLAAVLGEYRTTFEESWGPVGLQEEQWTLRIRVGTSVDAEGHTGVTYHHSHIVDVADRVPETFPHELRHVQLGRGSDDHHGWCAGFEPWEERVLGVDERTYLGCPR